MIIPPPRLYLALQMIFEKTSLPSDSTSPELRTAMIEEGHVGPQSESVCEMALETLKEKPRLRDSMINTIPLSLSRRGIEHYMND
jgi:hypothetical protein